MYIREIFIGSWKFLIATHPRSLPPACFLAILGIIDVFQVLPTIIHTHECLLLSVSIGKGTSSLNVFFGVQGTCFLLYEALI